MAGMTNDLPLLIVDGANVVGSVPDGWWRDRRGAAERLRDRLVAYATSGTAELPGPLELVLVVEGAARGWRPCRGAGGGGARQRGRPDRGAGRGGGGPYLSGRHRGP
ncbi:hypothetical protein GA0115256_138025 [Streptomyces sp. DconLS]|nr:hypothetical protein GA0115256_138025 [Streptomyces sp. DconLS]